MNSKCLALLLAVSFLQQTLATNLKEVTLTNHSDNQIQYKVLTANNKSACLTSVLEQQQGEIDPNNQITIAPQDNNMSACLAINNNIIVAFRWDVECKINYKNNLQLILSPACKTSEE